MTARPSDFFERCPDCGGRWFFAPRRSRETHLPLDLERAVLVCMDGEDNTPPWGLWDEYGYRIKGHVLDRDAKPRPGFRDVICYPAHRCPPRGPVAPSGKDAAVKD